MPVAVTRGTTVFSELMGRALYPTASTELQGGVRGGAEEDDDRTARSTNSDVTGHTEPLSDLESEGEEDIPPLIAPPEEEGGGEALGQVRHKDLPSGAQAFFLLLNQSIHFVRGRDSFRRHDATSVLHRHDS
jgi:hypothetical protein